MKGESAPIIVLDLEWTAWEGSNQRNWSAPGEEMEIVQIGAVKLADTDALDEIEAFEILVRPRINGRLDRYFLELTGISQERLDREGVDLNEALAAFAGFVGPATELCGFGDEMMHIVSNCQLYGLANPLAGRACQDVRPQIIEATGLANVPNSSDLPSLLNFNPPGAMHQGLSDSRCIAEALRRTRKLGKF